MRSKRLLDAGVALFLLLGFPVHLFLVRKPIGLLTHIFEVLIGKRTWVGYSTRSSELPPLRPGVLGTDGHPVGKVDESEDGLLFLDRAYAREYSVNRDLELITRGYSWLGT
jgi:hypothetical protein